MALITIAGSVLLAIASLREELNELFLNQLPKNWAPITAGAGMLIIIVGICCFLYSLKPPKTPVVYRYDKALGRELPLIYELAVSYFGPEISSLQTMQRWHKINNSIFFVVFREKYKRFRYERLIVGYFCGIPLKENAIEDIENESVTGAHIPEHFIAATPSECVAVYIGGIAANFRARPQLLSFINTEYVTNGKWAKTFYTRPINDDGKRIAKAMSFQTIDPAMDGQLNIIYKYQYEPPRPVTVP